jgi:DNA polymerase III epsilon subunit-like protein
MKYLFFDTETTGFPPKARLVSIAWQIWDNSMLLEKQAHIIKPDGFYIPAKATKIHGISDDFASENGENIKDIINLFNKKVSDSDIIIAHNFKFDSKIIDIECNLLNLENQLKNKQFIDTMLISTDYLKLPGKNNKYKWPNLSELYKYLFKKDFKNAHSADTDVDATVKCFFELKKRGVILD